MSAYQQVLRQVSAEVLWRELSRARSRAKSGPRALFRVHMDEFHAVRGELLHRGLI